MSDLAALFPGQGSLTDDARPFVADSSPELLDRVGDLLGDDPFERADESTAFAQPAIFCASLAGWRALDLDEPPLAVAGHSLGELTALAAAGALDTDDALRLVVLRGRLMADAGAAQPGTMLALLKATPEQAAALAGAHDVSVANDNAPGQVVLSGNPDKLKAVVPDARAAGLRTIALDVTGAFHSPAMAPAQEPFLAALNDVDFHEPRFPVYSSMSAGPFAVVRLQLAAALTRPVRWRETMDALTAAGATRFVDVGPGEVLARLVARNAPEAAVVTREVSHAPAS